MGAMAKKGQTAAKNAGPTGFAVKAITGCVWVVWTAVASTFFNNTFVHTFQDPLSHTIVRFIGAVVYGGIWAVLQGKPLPDANILKVLLPSSVCLIAANQLNSMALQWGGPTLPYILKSAIPVFTVLALFVMGNRYVPAVYASLIPICFGVAVASASDSSFNIVAFWMAFASTAAQVALNLLSKKQMAKYKVDSSTAFLAMCINCVVVLAPVGYLHANGIQDVAAPIMDEKHWQGDKALSSQILCVGAALAYWVEYALSFTMVSLVSPVEYCIMDIVRRLGTILFGAYLFDKTLSSTNLCGVFISLAGVAFYSFIEPKELRKEKTK